MSSLQNWFCPALALALTVLLLAQLETVSSLNCYDCNGTICNTFTTTGNPNPKGTCTGDVCYTIISTTDDLIKYQSCRPLKYFDDYLKKQDEDVKIGYCTRIIGGTVVLADEEYDGTQGNRYVFDEFEFVLLCACTINDMCNEGYGVDKIKYGKHTPIPFPNSKDNDGGASKSLSNFMEGSVLAIVTVTVTVIALSAWRHVGF